MRTTTTMTYLLRVLALAVLLASCDDDPAGVEPGEVAGVATNHERVDFSAIGDSAHVRAGAIIDGETDFESGDVEWSSLDPLVATVTDDGTIVSTGPGVTRVVASLPPYADSIVVFVRQEVASVEIDAPDSLTLTIGDTLTFPVVALDANGHEVPYTRFDWMQVSGDIVGVVTSSQQRGARGGVIARAPGEGKIVAVAAVSGIADTIHVTTLADSVDFALVSAGGFQTCGLDQLGTAYCWGALFIGRYPVLGGIGGTTFYAPTEVDTELAFDTLASAHSHACALEAGAAWCWGWNSEGELGSGSSESSAQPVQVAGGHVFETLVVGQYHACGVKANGEAWCWGANLYGQLGDSTLVDRDAPVQVGGGHQWAMLDAGPYHTCGITTGGAAYCWGHNDSKALGTEAGDMVCETMLGPATCSPAPVAVETDGHTFTSIDAGGFHTCALEANGGAWCWGRNDVGELGTGTQSQGSIIAPQQVTGGHTFVDLTTTQSFTCGLESDGDVWCWGVNTYGQLGSDAAQLCETSWLTIEPCMPTPVQVSGGIAFDAIDSGAFHACGFTAAGIPYCWGENSSGQLGIGGDEPWMSLTPLQVWGTQ